MIIQDAIKNANDLMPNHIEDAVLMRWLSVLDGKIYQELMVGLEDCPDDAPGVYDDPETELLVPFPYDEMYVIYLIAKISQQNADYDRYNNDMMAYNGMYADYAAMYARTHRSTDTAANEWNSTTDDEEMTNDW